ncbi:UdgX family uracil-DNA binding protein [Sphingomicrobium marinum]|uniref:UdgX family uracil-DNA binding protein n=1 Tax=Sphingomicrobium marinum TaxID=1227950 RepID=UPI00223EA1B1|nr:UdgX family uracil-DNA binding protein [Sphingomicrobium marinum]
MTRILPDGPQIDIHRVALDRQDDFAGWRDAARGLAEAGVPPEAVTWTVEGQTDELFGSQPPPAPSGGGFSVPKSFIGLATTVICHRDPERFSLLYAMLWKLRTNRRAMEDRADPLLDRLRKMEKEVRRDAHKMHAFVRFREVEDEDGERMVAWFEPDNYIVRREAGFFMRRFTNMRWSILTPQLCIHWDGETLRESPGATKADAPGGDPVEETWKTYYKSIFNPARVKVKAMTAEMPKKYWKNMPETEAIGELLASAQAREAAMIETSRAQESLLDTAAPIASWEELAKLARERHGTDRTNSGTQLVFGEGNRNAALMLVGEQPGDEEDKAGQPFVGPAGQLLDEMLERAGIERSELYVTNAVKRFKFVQRGKKRIHAKPTAGDIEHYRWWVEAERELVQPGLTLALGATAARSITGKTVTISKVRGEELALPGGGTGMVTIHPSYLLRLPDEAARAEQRARFIDDLKRAADRAAALAA